MLIWTDIQINNQSKKYFVLILKAHNIQYKYDVMLSKS